MASAVFLDRDGVLNRGAPVGLYVTRAADLVLLPQVGEALRQLQGAGHVLVVVTNQRGVALGHLSKDDLDAIHARLRAELAPFGVSLAAIKACTHGRDQRCGCRKPAPGMILEAAAELGIDLTRSYLVGDMATDVEAGRAAGVTVVRVATDGAGEPGADPPADFRCPSLKEAAEWILGRKHLDGKRGSLR